jgi:hypothetical protein
MIAIDDVLIGLLCVFTWGGSLPHVFRLPSHERDRSAQSPNFPKTKPPIALPIGGFVLI